MTREIIGNTFGAVSEVSEIGENIPQIKDYLYRNRISIADGQTAVGARIHVDMKAGDIIYTESGYPLVINHFHAYGHKMDFMGHGMTCLIFVEDTEFELSENGYIYDRGTITTADEVFDNLFAKYGENFTWSIIPFSDKSFVNELLSEIGESDPIYKEKIYAVAKCELNDDVLYVINNQRGIDLYRIYHLTYSKNNEDGFPRFKEFWGINAVSDYIEKKYAEEYL